MMKLAALLLALHAALSYTAVRWSIEQTGLESKHRKSDPGEGPEVEEDGGGGGGKIHITTLDIIFHTREVKKAGSCSPQALALSGKAQHSTAHLTYQILFQIKIQGTSLWSVVLAV